MTVNGINQEYSQNNAVIHRLADKLLVGGATEHDGAFPVVTGDWFADFQKTKSLLRVVGAAASGSTTSGSAVVTFTAGGIVPEAGNYIFSETIPPDTKILSVDSATQITLDNNATATGTGLTLLSNRDSDLYAGTAFGQIRSITNTSRASTFGGAFASQTFYFDAAGSSSIGIASFAVNNNATLATNCWGGYFEAFRLSSTVGGARGIEIDVVSTSAEEILPNAFQQSQTACLQMGAGNGLAGELPSGKQVNIGAAIQILPNPLRFRAGIVFMSASIEGTDGYTGNGPAIRMGTGHSLEWHNPSQDLVARVLCITGITSAQRTEIRFGASGVQFVGAGGTSGFIFNSNPTTLANWWTLAGAATGNAPTIAAGGTDTNVDLLLSGQGTGVVRYGTHAAVTTETLSGFITIKDSAGNTRKLAVVS
jgi:hypothetical protein